MESMRTVDCRGYVPITGLIAERQVSANPGRKRIVGFRPQDEHSVVLLSCGKLGPISIHAPSKVIEQLFVERNGNQLLGVPLDSNNVALAVLVAFDQSVFGMNGRRQASAQHLNPLPVYAVDGERFAPEDGFHVTAGCDDGVGWFISCNVRAMIVFPAVDAEVLGKGAAAIYVDQLKAAADAEYGQFPRERLVH